MTDAKNWDAEIWNERYKTLDEDEEPSSQIEVNPHVERLLADSQPGRALDVACGAGRNVLWLAEQGWDTHGVDFSEKGLEIARKRLLAAGLDATLHQGDVVGGWEPEQSFDLVMLCYLHWRHGGVVPLVKQMATWAPPGGELLVIGIDKSSHPLTRGPNKLHQLYSVDQLSRPMEDEGLEVTVADVWSRVIDSETGTETIYDTVVMARRPEATSG